MSAGSTTKIVLFRQAAAEGSSRGRAAVHLLESKGITRYPFRPCTREDAKESRLALIGALERAGHVKEARRLVRCETRYIWTKGPSWTGPVFLGCGAAYCPVCVIKRRNSVFRAMRGVVASTIGSTGAAAHLILSLPRSGSTLLDRLDSLGVEVRTVKQTSTWRTRYQPVLGVVMGLEVEGGQALDGHPHAHLFVFSGDTGQLHSFIAWMSERWQRRTGWVLMVGCQVFLCSDNPDEWAPRLRYVMKGSELCPDWPMSLIHEVALSLSARKRLLTFWGLARREGGWLRKRAKRKVVSLHSRTTSPLASAG